ncbi:MAG: hypothetical protein JXR64_02885 [Spirochaetales bacterium]|nr:hypothetical protein [Spirochaetales bacterium]
MEAQLENKVKADKYYSAKSDVVESLTFNDLLISKSLSGFGIVSNIDIIRHMNDTLLDSGLEFNLDKIYAKNNLVNKTRGIEIDHDSLTQYPSITDQNGNILYNPHSLRFNRVAGSFKIDSLANGETYGFIGFAATHRGYELAIGTEVSICSNMCILNANNRISTFGDAKIGDVNAIMKRLKEWTNSYGEIDEQNKEKIALMQSLDIDENYVRKIFGKLYELNHTKNEEMIIGANMLSKTQKYYVNNFYEKEEVQIQNIWDLYNAFTYNLKFENTDFVNIFEQNQKIGDFLLNSRTKNYEHYKLN